MRIASTDSSWSVYSALPRVGVEPWYFYFVNGFLNFNVVFVMALLAVLLIEVEVGSI